MIRQATRTRSVDRPKLVLASRSPRRTELLLELGIPFEVRPVDIDETVDPALAKGRAVEDLARRKAFATPRKSGEWVIAADTLVYLGEKPLGKPTDREDARRMLQGLSGSRHAVISGVALIGAGGRMVLGHEVTEVVMRPLSASEIDRYVESGECDDKAGAYAIQETGDRFIAALGGSWSNVVGLPMGLLVDLLRILGFESLGAASAPRPIARLPDPPANKVSR
jgi:septum formation protein